MVINNIKIEAYVGEDLEGILRDMFSYFEGKSEEVRPVHLLTRRLESVASLVFIFGLLNILSRINVLFNKPISFSLSDFGQTFPGLSPNNMVHCLVVANLITLLIIVFGFYVNKINYSRLVISIYATVNFFSVVFFNWCAIAPYFVLFGLLIFISCYSSNRKYGYTRSFSRYRFYCTKIQILYVEKKLSLDCDDNIRLKFHELIVSAAKEAHADIVGDYVAYGDSALKWLSKNNK